jgi:hypothetical protein
MPLEGRGKDYSATRAASEWLLARAFRGGWTARLVHRLGLQPAVVTIEHRITCLRWPEAVRPLRIGFVSDLHQGPTTHSSLLAEAAHALRAAQPDVLLLGGDHVYLHGAGIHDLVPRFGRGRALRRRCLRSHARWTHCAPRRRADRFRPAAQPAVLARPLGCRRAARDREQGSRRYRERVTPLRRSRHLHRHDWTAGARPSSQPRRRRRGDGGVGRRSLGVAGCVSVGATSEAGVVLAGTATGLAVDGSDSSTGAARVDGAAGCITAGAIIAGVVGGST